MKIFLVLNKFQVLFLSFYHIFAILIQSIPHLQFCYSVPTQKYNYLVSRFIHNWSWFHFIFYLINTCNLLQQKSLLKRKARILPYRMIAHFFIRVVQAQKDNINHWDLLNIYILLNRSFTAISHQITLSYWQQIIKIHR